MSRAYFELDHRGGYPRATSLFYECVKCGEVVPSDPPESTSCRCYNVCIDVEYGRLALHDKEAVRAFIDEDGAR